MSWLAPMSAVEGPRQGGLVRKYSLALASLVTAALIVSGSVEAWFSYQEHREALVRIQQEKANAAAAAIQRFVAELEAQIGWTTHLAILPSPDALEQSRFDFLRLLRQAPSITDLIRLDATGREQLRVSRVAMDVLGSGVDYAADPRFVEAQARGVYASPVYFHKESEPYISLAVAGTGRQSGVTVAEVNLKFIWDVISLIKIGETGAAYVVDAAGRLIAHPDISLVLRKTDMTGLAHVVAAMASRSDEAGMVAGDIQGREVLTTHAPVAALNWLVFVDLPVREAFAPLYASLLRTLALVVLGVILATLGGFVLARRMVGPIRLLQEGASRIGSGELDHRIAVQTGDELESLGDEFNSMAQRLSESYHGLEQKIADRTRELSEALEQLQSLAQVGQTVNSSLDLGTVLGAILAHACDFSDSGGGAIYVCDESEAAFSLVATHGMSLGLIEALRGVSIRRGETVIGQCAVRRDAVQIPDLEDCPGYPLHDAFLRAGVRALLGVPLMREGRVTGALVVRRKRPGAFSPGTLDTLKAFASQSALAIQNARLFQEIDQKGRQLEQANRHKSQFLANMSHELRTPMNAILGFTELIQDGIYGEAPPRIQAVLERVQANGRHLLALINDVLDLSKIDAGQLTLSLQDYSLKEVIQGVVSGTEPLAAAKRLALRAELPSELPRGHGDERRIAQVLLNLVGNAIKFTEAGEVVLSVRAESGRLVVAVSDTGPGIPEAEQQKIFEEFHQVDSSSTREKGGTGLGLAISRRIVELHGGTIRVESEPGKGSCFLVTLPLRAEERKAA